MKHLLYILIILVIANVSYIINGFELTVITLLANIFYWELEEISYENNKNN